MPSPGVPAPKSHGREVLPPAKDIHEMVCMCGQLHRIPYHPDEKRYTCKACKRTFEAGFITDPETGINILNPMYTDVDPDPTLESAVGAPVTLQNARAPAASESSSRGVLDDIIEPEPPHAMYFICPCRSKLLARKEMYDKRVRCPDCKTRLLITVVYDPGAKVFDIKPVRLDGTSSGDTQQLPRL